MKNHKLWQKKNNEKLNEYVESYTVGIDYILDQELLKHDVEASIAHVEMLCSIGIMTKDETKKVIEGLGNIIKKANKNGFIITQSDEDGHSAIEKFLTQKCGDAGKKIHTGRSRNDQILVAMRLYMKSKVTEIYISIESLIKALTEKSKKYSGTIMPGYTHMQRAMPSSVSLWLLSFRDALKDSLIILESMAKILDQNPLGSIVGYGEKTLGLDREITTKKLNFSKVQVNPMYCALSRGKFELMTLQSLYPAMFDIGKLATDLLLFSTKEFNFCSLPHEFTTGSSAMPQKRNYDVLEIIRGNVSSYNGNTVILQNIVDKLPSGYNRDFQLTKEPFMKGIKIAKDSLEIMTLIIENLEIHTGILEKACTSELYATEKAYELVKKQGTPFRDAYKIVGKNYTQNGNKDN